MSAWMRMSIERGAITFTLVTGGKALAQKPDLRTITPTQAVC
jgi:hypothetical protein